jgi:hypothetical protein
MPSIQKTNKTIYSSKLPIKNSSTIIVGTIPYDDVDNDDVDNDDVQPYFIDFAKIKVMTGNDGMFARSFDPGTIKKIKIIPFESKWNLSPLDINDFHSFQIVNKTGLKCDLCSIEYNEGDKINIFKCDHHSCIKCTNSWFRQHDTCISCKISICPNSNTISTSYCNLSKELQYALIDYSTINL